MIEVELLTSGAKSATGSLPLTVAIASAKEYRRQAVRNALLEMQDSGGIEERTFRDCSLESFAAPEIALPRILQQRSDLVITDSRFDWQTPGSTDGIERIIRSLRDQAFTGKIFCLGMYTGHYDTEYLCAREAGADGLIEEDFVHSPRSRHHFIDGIRTLLERPPYRYFAGINTPVTLM